MESEKKTLTILFIIAQLLDLNSTIIGITFFDILEANPLLKNLQLSVITIIKLLAIGVLVVAMIKLHERLPVWIYWIMLGTSSMVVAWNLLVILAEIFI